jgi:hypothetical protein
VPGRQKDAPRHLFICTRDGYRGVSRQWKVQRGSELERDHPAQRALANFFSEFVIQMLGNLLLMVGVLLMLWWVDWRIGLALSLFAGLLLGIPPAHADLQGAV